MKLEQENESNELDVYLNGEPSAEEPKEEEIPKGTEEAETEEPSASQDKAEEDAEIPEEKETDTEEESDDAETEDKPEVDEDVSLAQSKDKNHPLNKVFSKLRREKKEFELKQAKQADIDKKYEALALKAGRKDIKTAEDYIRALDLKDGVDKFNETQDATDLIRTIKSDILSEIAPVLEGTQHTIEEAGQSKVDEDLAKQVTDLNEKYGTELKTFDDVANLPDADKIIDYLEKGVTLDDAYTLVNQKDIFEKAQKASTQKAINKVKGRTHVKANGNNDSIKKDQLTQAEIDTHTTTWQGWFPDAKPSEIKAYMLEAKKLGEL